MRRIPTDVTIELAIIRVARIADDRTPDLLTRLHVARKDGDAVGATHGRVDAVTRARCAVEDRVRVGDEVFETGTGQQRFESFGVSAFGQPDAARATTEMFLIIGDGDLYLRTTRGFGRDKRQEAVRRAAGDQFGDACVL